MADNKRVVIAGATGMIGRALSAQLIDKGYQVVVFSRDPQKARRSVPGAAEYVAWTPAETGAWAGAVDGAHAVINLAGASLFGQRWTEAYKREIIDSRVIGTRGLVQAMAAAKQRPQVFISTSAVGYYGPSGDRKLDESAPAGNDFLAREVCVPWERAAQPADERVHGPLNATAPETQTNRDFAKAIGRVLGRPAWLPVPGFAMKLLLGEMADMITTGQRAVPKQAQDLGYQFKFPTSEQAIRQSLQS